MAKGDKRPIGVFDSGLGGLTVVRELQKKLPYEHIVYLGDMARLPYGTKSKKQIIAFSKNNAAFLLSKNVKVLVVACNSSAANAYMVLKKSLSIPVIDVIRPVVKEVATASGTSVVGILGTTATIVSDVYRKEIQKLKKVSVVSLACPLFVPLVEEGMLTGAIAESIVKKYVAPIKKAKCTSVVLGCTHYPLLKKAISTVLGKKITVFDSGPSTAQEVEAVCKEKGLLSASTAKGRLDIYLTDKSPNFLHVGERFLKRKIDSVKIITI